MKVVADTFPAGTLSGAPKHRAMQLIEQYEKIVKLSPGKLCKGIRAGAPSRGRELVLPLDQANVEVFFDASEYNKMFENPYIASARGYVDEVIKALSTASLDLTPVGVAPKYISSFISTIFQSIGVVPSIIDKQFGNV